MSDNITIDDAVNKQLLDDIQHFLLVLGERSGDRLESFSTPYSPGKDWLIAYQMHLKDLWRSISGTGGCKPSCSDGSCPPCFGWNLDQYKSYKETLRRLTETGSSETKDPDAPSN